MSTATMTEQHTYAENDQPMVNAEHFAIKGTSVFRCIQEDCDGEHHWYCSCRRS